jgi:hypothetical protein
LNLPNESQFLYLTTRGWKTGKQHTIEIWFVGYRQWYYVMSERRYKAHWVQNILHNQKIKFSINNIIYEACLLKQIAKQWPYSLNRKILKVLLFPVLYMIDLFAFLFSLEYNALFFFYSKLHRSSHKNA